jgi:hypothetical protein
MDAAEKKSKIRDLIVQKSFKEIGRRHIKIHIKTRQTRLYKHIPGQSKNDAWCG